jgi:hypothetical protein
MNLKLFILRLRELCRYMRHKEHKKIKQTVELLNEQSNKDNNEPKQA